MPGFRYRATGPDGKPLRGVIEADDHDEAQRRIVNRGWGAVHVTAARLPPLRRPHDEGPSTDGHKRLWTGLLLLLLLVAIAALLWFDPYGWGLLEQWGLAEYLRRPTSVPEP